MRFLLKRAFAALRFYSWWFWGSVDPENNALIINGTTVHIITANGPEEIDYTLFDIHNALVIDNTGAFTTHEALSRHLVSKELIKYCLPLPEKEFQILYMA
jgi:glyceraldehyde 3-phosphate dehydrogenase